MSELLQASHQWSSRPDDERFLSLYDMLEHFRRIRAESRAVVVGSRRIHAAPDQDNRGMQVTVRQTTDDVIYTPNHWSFGQVCQLAEAPAGYLRTLASPIAADCINYGLLFKRNIEDVGLLLQHNGDAVLRAATGPRYGRIWNAEILETLTQWFGNGTGDTDWRVPGEFGRAVEVTKANTTLYASDRDMFVFLADEKNRIEVPGRRNGHGLMARGFFVWNSEVGSKTWGLGTFLFDYVCCNRIVWGSSNYSEMTIRHTASAPDRWLEEMQPALLEYQKSSTAGITDAIAAARDKKLDKVDEFLAQRFGRRLVGPINAVHMLEEDRPIETVWDATVAVTAYAKSVAHQDARVELERQAGDLLKASA